jgi:hypothetical protein
LEFTNHFLKFLIRHVYVDAGICFLRVQGLFAGSMILLLLFPVGPDQVLHLTVPLVGQHLILPQLRVDGALDEALDLLLETCPEGLLPSDPRLQIFEGAVTRADYLIDQEFVL